MKSITKFWLLDNFNLVKGLESQELVKLCKKLEGKSIEKGEEFDFINEGKPIVFFLISGTVKIVSTSTNRTKYIVKNGNIFGEITLLLSDKSFDPKKINAKAIALEDCFIGQIEANQITNLMNKDSFASLKNELYQLHFLKMRWLDQKITDLAISNTRTRVTQCIFNYIFIFGSEHDGKITAKNLLSHLDIAHLSNVSRQTVSNVMSVLRKESIIYYDSKIISLIDQTALKKREIELDYL